MEGQTGGQLECTGEEVGIHEIYSPGKLGANGGQIAQAVLRDTRVDINRLLTDKHRQTGLPRCRQSLMRTRSGVGVPNDLTLKALQDKKTACMTTARSGGLSPYCATTIRTNKVHRRGIDTTSHKENHSWT